MLLPQYFACSTLIPSLGFWVTFYISRPHAQLYLNDHHETGLESTSGVLKPTAICSFQIQSKQMTSGDARPACKSPWAGGTRSINWTTANLQSHKQEINVVNHWNLRAVKQYHHNKNLTNASNLIHLPPSILLLMPPSGQTQQEIEGKKAHWCSP